MEDGQAVAAPRAQPRLTSAEPAGQRISPERWQQIKAILDQAGEAPAERQAQVVAAACGNDSALEREVLSFLVADDEIEDFIEQPLWTLPPAASPRQEPPDDPAVGHRVGPYRIERLLGRGGMGSVFLAVREDDYRKRVALKLVSWGTESQDVLDRFYVERQILAGLEHPGIARLLDGGTTGDGRPYLVMEYVEGEPIDRYCAARRLGIGDRLRLFCEVCAAVHFAHQHLVIHRDLKAGNILVTAQGRPRLLDFGIAKLLDPATATPTAATLPGLVPMTPTSASPEQVSGGAITTATDVYALGVLLYRLLAGRLPFRFPGKSYPEMAHAICNTEPAEPSVAVLEVAGASATPADRADGSARRASETLAASEARRRRRRLAGDLDAIVAKAMRKEPRHRYGSATELAADIRRHLQGLPVKARQGTRRYLLGRFLRRHKLALAVVLLIAGSAVTATALWRQAVRERAHAERQRARAEHQQARAERVSQFLEDLFASADPDRRGDDVRVREILELGRERIDRDLADEPALQAELLGTLGTVYQNLGLFDQARELKQNALEKRRAASRGPSRDLAKDLNNLASLLYATRDYEAAEHHLREVLTMQRSLGEDDAEIARTQHNLASTLMQSGRYRDAEALIQEALELRQHRFGGESAQVASSLYSLGALYSNRGQFDQAEPLLRRALELRIALYGPEDTRVATILGSLGWLLHARGAHGLARESYQQALTIRRTRLGADHPAVAATQKNLVAVLLSAGETEAAGALLEEALAVLRRPANRSGWNLADAESLFGVFLAQSGRHQEAEGRLIAGYRTIRALRGDASADTRRALRRIVDFYSAWDRPEEAAEYRALLEETDGLNPSDRAGTREPEPAGLRSPA